MKIWTKLALVTTGLFFCLYASTASHFAAGYADSDEFLTAGWLFGVSHPPGYGLLVSMVGLVMRLAPHGMGAWAANLLASTLMSASIGFVVMSSAIASDLFDSPHQLSRRLTAISVLLPAYLLGISGLFWLYSGVLEVASLSVLLVSLNVYLSLLWYQCYVSGGSWILPFFATWFVAGLLLGHIQTGILMLPGFLLLLIGGVRARKGLRWSNVGMGLGFFFLALAFSFSLLWYFNSRQADVSWFFEPSLTGLRRHVMRADYAGHFIEESVTRNAYAAPLTWAYLTSQDDYIALLIKHLGLFFVSLVIFSILLIFLKKLRWWSAAIVAWTLFGGFMLAGRLGLPSNDPQQLDRLARIGVIERQYLLGMSVMPILVTIGLYWILVLFLRRFREPIVFNVMLPIALILLFVGAHSNFLIGFSASRSFSSKYVESMLSEAAADSVIICGGDISCFGLMYATEVLGIRSDVTILSKNNLYRKYFLAKHPEYYGLLYDENPYYYAHLIAWNLQSRHVYLSNPTDFYIDYIGLNGDPFFLIPKGYLFEIVKQKPTEFATLDRSVSNAVLVTPIPDNDHFSQGMREYLASLHLTTGNLYALYGERQLAADELGYALALKPDFEKATAMLTELEYYAGDVAYTRTAETSIEDLKERAYASLTEEDFETAYSWYRKATYYDPTDVVVRNDLAHLLEKAGYLFEASWEIEHALLFDPDNTALINYYQSLVDAFTPADRASYEASRS